MNIIRDYQEALDYIYSFINFSITRNLRYSEEKFNLNRMNQLMSLLGDPHLDYDVVHVAGTKGKGSTCAMIAAIMQEAGYKVGFYSSPHMIDLRERIKVNNADISEETLIRLLNLIKPAINNVNNISTFEIITGLAFKYFSENQVDIAIIEVGMGGRLDATNIVNPKVSVITPISLDHTKILGDTIEEIAAEKAGIIKNGIPVVVSKQPQIALAVITEIAAKMNSDIINADEKYKWEQKDYSIHQQEFRIHENGSNTDQHIYKLPLVGDHQLDNAVTAFATIKQLAPQYQIVDEDIVNGFRNVKWPGRFELISEFPMVIVDGAHNPDSFRKLADTIKKYLADKDITLIFGASEDKDIQTMVEIARSVVKEIIFTKADHPRALNQDEIQVKLENILPGELNFLDIEKIPEIINKEKERTYIAAGSIFVASAIKELFNRQNLGK